MKLSGSRGGDSYPRRGEALREAARENGLLAKQTSRMIKNCLRGVPK
jgi:hypothetical protein